LLIATRANGLDLWNLSHLSSNNKIKIMKTICEGLSKLLLLVVIGFVLSSCGERERYKAEDSMTSSVAYEGEVVDASAPAYEANAKEVILPPIVKDPSRVETKIPAKIIYTADIRFQVQEIATSYSKIKALTSRYNGYLASDNLYQNDFEKNQNFTVRVPALAFDSLLKELEGESIFTQNKTISANDVTDQFVDIEARLKTKKELEQRYLAILRQASKVADILEVEQKLAEIREEIEAQEGRMKLLQDQVTYSTINLSIYQTLEFKQRPSVSFFSQFLDAIVNGFDSFKGFLLNLVSLWPFLIVVLIIFFAIRYKIKSRK
jgi:hypothetical protein